MGLEEVCHERKKKKLYSDLFKPSAAEKEEQSMVISGHSSWVSTSSSSPTSGLSTPFFSDFESDDDADDFMAELTRQMAECMLQEEEEEENDEKIMKKNNKEEQQQGCVVDYGGAIKNGFNSGPLGADDGNGISPFQVYELKKNKPPVRKEGHFNRGKRVKGAESARQKTQQQKQYRGGRNGSGMQAVFLGGSGSVSGPPGTGVFLPRVTTDPPQIKKRTGCSIVLMPTRVLQALEQHFKQRHQHSTTLSSGAVGGSLIHSGPKDETNIIPNGQLEKNKRLGNIEEEMQLPQEWTY